jgi:hypothetical protein
MERKDPAEHPPSSAPAPGPSAEPLQRITQELIRKETLERAELDRLLAAPELEPAGASLFTPTPLTRAGR